MRDDFMKTYKITYKKYISGEYGAPKLLWYEQANDRYEAIANFWRYYETVRTKDMTCEIMDVGELVVEYDLRHDHQELKDLIKITEHRIDRVVEGINSGELSLNRVGDELENISQDLMAVNM
jgi:replicative DNA helicase